MGFETKVEGQTRYGTGHVQIQAVEVRDAGGEPRRAFRLGESITIEATLKSRIDLDHLSVSFLVRDQTGVDLMGTTTFDERIALPHVARAGQIRIRFCFENTLRPGSFGVCLAVTRVSQRDYSDVVLLDQVDACATFMVMADPERPVHYKFHQPVSINWEVLNNGS
jgi:lipopolysaccharide transport system ATP-binding protein